MEFGILCPVLYKRKISAIYLNFFPAMSVWWEKLHLEDEKNRGLKTTRKID